MIRICDASELWICTYAQSYAVPLQALRAQSVWVCKDGRESKRVWWYDFLSRVVVDIGPRLVDTSRYTSGHKWTYKWTSGGQVDMSTCPPECPLVHLMSTHLSTWMSTCPSDVHQSWTCVYLCPLSFLSSVYLSCYPSHHLRVYDVPMYQCISDGCVDRRSSIHIQVHR